MTSALTAREHRVAVLEALLVTFLWSTSWVLIRWGLRDLPPLTFAGLRYGLAAAILLAARTVRRRGRRSRPEASRPWGPLLLLGLVFYGLTQGAQFLALTLLPTATVSLFLSGTPLLVGAASGIWLREPPSRAQWVGALVLLAGAATYLGSTGRPAGAALWVAILAVVANAWAALLGRSVHRSRRWDVLDATAVSMSVGAAALLVAGRSLEPWPVISARSWTIVGWLAGVNTALAFWLWSHTQRLLTATESSVLNNTMLLQIAVLAWIFLGETLSARETTGLVAVALGAALVQWSPSPVGERIERPVPDEAP